MPSRTVDTKSQPILTSTEAQLYVADVNASGAFFTSKLGFAIAFVYGEPPFYGQVHRGEARLNLRMVSEPVFAGDIRERESLLSASITVSTNEQIEKLFVEFESAGVPFHQTLREEPWGAKTFIARDLDGNLILFAGPAS
jgi:catechol 2,3-dioxygenase-like lactoylglutathione lyase family enzyme